MIISCNFGLEKVFDRVQSPFMIKKKPFNKMGTEEMYFKIIKATLKTPQLISYSIVKNWKFFFKIRKKKKKG